MCPPVLGAIAPFVPLITQFIGNRNQNRNQPQPMGNRNALAQPAQRFNQAASQQVRDDEQQKGETKQETNQSQLGRKNWVTGGVNTQAGGAQQSDADTSQGLVGSQAANYDPTGVNVSYN